MATGNARRTSRVGGRRRGYSNCSARARRRGNTRAPCGRVAVDTLDALLAGIVADPLEETRWLVLADYLEENDDPRRAELLRLHRRLIGTCCEPDAHPDRAEWQARV